MNHERKRVNNASAIVKAHGGAVIKHNCIEANLSSCLTDDGIHLQDHGK